MTKSRCVIVVSDLHLGGEAPHMMSHPRELARFIADLPSRVNSDETLELVLNGDFVDFLTAKPWESWTAEPAVAASKLLSASRPPFDVVFEALKRYIESGHHLTIVVGNHDIEFIYPQVQATLLQQLGTAWPDRVRFVDDGSAWRVGGAIIEHGNRYDPANRNDWERLRLVRSRASRGEACEEVVRVSPGSKMVTHIVNHLRPEYPFIDLVQPQGELLALLLLVLEPSLAFDFPMIARAFHLARLMESGHPPSSYQANDGEFVPVDQELDALFGEHYRQLHSGASEPTGLAEFAGILDQARRGSLKRQLLAGEPIPERRLEKLRALLCRLLPRQDVFSPDGDMGACGEAAAQMRAATGAEVVVMGHTHMARRSGPQLQSNYINTGAWADVVRVPPEVTGPTKDYAKLTGFLVSLLNDEARSWMPTFAEIRLRPDGCVVKAQLCVVER